MVEKKYRPSVLFLTRKDPANCFVAQGLSSSKSINLRAVLIESRSMGRRQLLYKKICNAYKKNSLPGALKLIIDLPYLYFQDRGLLKMQKQKLWGGSDPLMPQNVPVHCFDDLNSRESINFVKEMDADFLIVMGTRILIKELYSASKSGAINIHMGITPEYRGSKGEFWALYRDDLENIGFTVHFIDDGIDTGEILYQHFTRPELNDNERTLRIKNIFNVVPAVELVLENLQMGVTLQISREGRKSCFFSTPSMFQYMRLHWRLRREKNRKRMGMKKH
ncbi:MAG: formyl transferase [Deltaproteobacteria bacterium]|nr:formyl transferase [Deltaproteobacteria bacterium]